MLPSSHMKSTFELPDALFRQLREHAARNGTTIKAVLQAALRMYFRGAGKGRAPRFKLRDGSVRGMRLVPGVNLSDWSSINEIIYEGRGGTGRPSR
ncbi:MAG: hypothetical protein FJ253_01605 [Phycisphaerae bacterium]|nr:hypothetical protein [Phycisphaerae bacterium]